MLISCYYRLDRVNTEHFVIHLPKAFCCVLCMFVNCVKQRASADNSLSRCSFYLDGRQMENVAQFAHLGHIITARLDDAEDIHHRRCDLIGQINSVLCYFHGLYSAVKVRLIKAYCLSLYGCELWDLCNSRIETICFWHFVKV